MSEKRREKRATERAEKDPKNAKQTMIISSAKVVFDSKKVEIVFPFKKYTYYAKADCREYMNYALLFSEDGREGLDDYAKVLVGLEMMPSFCHSDAVLAQKVLDVVIDDMEQKLADIKPRGYSEEELLQDAEALLELEMNEMLKNE